MPINHPTQNETTKTHYDQRVRKLVRRFRKIHGVPDRERVDYRIFVGWLAQEQAGKSRNTWKQYKSAVLAHFQQINDPIADEAGSILSQIYSNGGLKRGTKTSSSKLKKFPLKDLYKIHQHFKNSRSQWAVDVQRWIEVSILTGLRPQEWKNASLIQVENGDALRVKNAKNSNGRAFGPERTIVLSLISPEEKQRISEHIKNVQEWEEAGQYNHFYNSCSSALNQAAKKIWPKSKKRPTLYSCRHQFSANAKASGLSRHEIAALMGHLSPDTAGIHYGRKLAGQEMLRVTPYEPEVDMIYKQEYQKKPAPKPSNLLKPNPTNHQLLS